ncbi:hypothetical protein G3M48_007034 [Beauveria asiatica]|uniref:Uncharacterized protein n=1 Tax=Beauveria asiatica TaxID=1069075 RepID=A0AAW0RMZ3_9HYPO
MRAIFNRTYDGNVSGTHVLTYSLALLLIKSTDPRLIFVTSSLSTLSRLSGGFIPGWTTWPPGWRKPPTCPSPTPIAYRTSKAALNMIMLNWHWILREDDVKSLPCPPDCLPRDWASDRSEPLQLLDHRG